MKIKTILAPVDGSPTAQLAVSAAADLAAKYGARLLLVHVRHRFGADVVPEELMGLAQAEHIRVTEADMLAGVSNQILNEAEAIARKDGASDIARQSRVGNAAAEIADAAREAKADLIVMGRRGLGRVGGLLLGSVTAKVMQLCEVPCLTVA